MLIELHSLTSHPPANLNRDDLGRPKTAVFGGVTRARISSQSLKRSVRRSPYLAAAFDGRFATRSNRHPEQLRDRLVKELGEEHRERIGKVVHAFIPVLGKEDKKRPFYTSQIVFLTPEEVERIYAYLRDLATQEKPLTKKELGAIKEEGGEATGLNAQPGDAIDLALFGRMTTDDAEAFKAVEASMQVAHPISTHAVETETDWFTAVDDITQNLGGRGSGHLNETEFNAAVFYKYFSCNLPLLVENLREDRKDAVEALAAFLDAACRVTPSGKQNSFASHALADTVLLVLREARVPVSLANAFEHAVPPSATGYLGASRNRMAAQYADLVRSYGLEDRTVAFASSEAAREEVRKHLPAEVEVKDRLEDLFDFLKSHTLNGGAK